MRITSPSRLLKKGETKVESPISSAQHRYDSLNMVCPRRGFGFFRSLLENDCPPMSAAKVFGGRVGKETACTGNNHAAGLIAFAYSVEMKDS
jgi:hypothetical protein